MGIHVYRFSAEKWPAKAALRLGCSLDARTIQSELIEPHGCTLLAWDGGKSDPLIGLAAFRRLADNTCEIRHLTVGSTRCREGIDATLLRALLDAARAERYQRVRVVFAASEESLYALYRAVGFAVAPIASPPTLAGLVAMELAL